MKMLMYKMQQGEGQATGAAPPELQMQQIPALDPSWAAASPPQRPGRRDPGGRAAYPPELYPEKYEMNPEEKSRYIQGQLVDKKPGLLSVLDSPDSAALAELLGKEQRTPAPPRAKVSVGEPAEVMPALSLNDGSSPRGTQPLPPPESVETRFDVLRRKLRGGPQKNSVHELSPQEFEAYLLDQSAGSR